MQRKFGAINHMSTAFAVRIAGLTLTGPIAALAVVSRLAISVLLSAGVGGDGDQTNHPIALAMRGGS